MTAGRPTKYLPEYCDKIIANCEQGWSFQAFAADVNVTYKTLHLWAAAHEEFAEAMKIAEAKKYKFVEKTIRDRLDSKDANTGMVVLWARNVGRWAGSDRAEDAEEDKKDNKPAVNIYLNKQD